MEITIYKSKISSIKKMEEYGEVNYGQFNYFLPYRLHVYMMGGEKYTINAPNEKELEKIYNDLTSKASETYIFNDEKKVVPTTEYYREWEKGIADANEHRDKVYKIAMSVIIAFIIGITALHFMW